MPSVSKAQQRLMGMAYALKKGDMKLADVSQEVKDLADSMSLQQLKDFAETKHEDLPDHVEEDEVNEWLPGVSAGHKWYTQTAQAAVSYGSKVKDHNDKLIQTFIEFIETGKRPKKPKTDKLSEDGESSAPQATPINTNGMGNVELPGLGKLGSGDRFEDEDEDEENVGIISYELFKKMRAKSSFKKNVK